MNFIPLKLSVTNCFLVKAGDHYVLIDTGYEDDWRLVRTRLNKAGVELFQLSHVILTHHHDDHCGLLHNILRENDSIRVVMSHLCKDLILKGENDRTHGGGFLNRRIALRSADAATLESDESGDNEHERREGERDEGHQGYPTDENLRHLVEWREVQYRLAHLQRLADELD